MVIAICRFGHLLLESHFAKSVVLLEHKICFVAMSRFGHFAIPCFVKLYLLIFLLKSNSSIWLTTHING